MLEVALSSFLPFRKAPSEPTSNDVLLAVWQKADRIRCRVCVTRKDLLATWESLL